MRSRNSTPVGALHPILFFAGVYVVVLFFSIFICSTIFYSCNASKADMADKSEQKAPAKESRSSATSIAAVQ
jgi:Na+-transporting methylmalonyl-CoA/oxaloacetate decarboxylase gamma subunit